MKTFLVLALVTEDGTCEFVGCFTQMIDLEACCHEDHVYSISGIRDGQCFYKSHFRV